MKTITKKYKIYNFNELDKKVQKIILDFQLRSHYSNWFMENRKIPSSKEIIALSKYVKKEAKKLYYFKNGRIAYISENE